MHYKNVDQILYNTLIDKGIIFEQVWQIYNKNKIPLTETEYEKLMDEGKYEGNYYFGKVWEDLGFNDEFGDSKEDAQQVKYKKKLETEEEARVRYEKFKDKARKDVRKVLEILKSPLIYYEKSKQIPVIVAATFAAIADLKKYGSLSPTQMIAVSPDNADETIEKFLLHSKIIKGEEYNYFIFRVIENLKYFFNLTTEENERNMEEIPKFNYKIIFDKGHYLIEKRKVEGKEINKEQQEINFDAKIMKNEIEDFKRIYLDIVNVKRDEDRKVRELLIMADRMLRIYSEDVYRNSMDKLNGIVRHLDIRTDDKIEIVFLLDFTEEPFKNIHEVLGKSSSDKFYKQRLELKKDESAYSRATGEIVNVLENVKKAADQESKNLLRQSMKII